MAKLPAYRQAAEHQIDIKSMLLSMLSKKIFVYLPSFHFPLSTFHFQLSTFNFLYETIAYLIFSPDICKLFKELN
jgi:hypothetical protein